jgi:flagellar export protein FliJ
MPPKYVFQNILDIRHSKVESIEIQLGNAENKLHALEKRKDLFQVMKSGYLEEMRIRMKDEIDVFQLEILRSNVKKVDDSLKRLDVEIADMKKKISLIRMNLVKAKQDEETLEILKEKENEKFLAEMKRIEGNQQDDVYISMAFKNRQQGA